MKAKLARVRALVLALAGFGATGCPAVLEDDFTTVRAGAAGEMASGGTSPSMGGKFSGGGTSGAGAEAVGGDASGAPDRGGSGPNAGTSSGAGTAGTDVGMAGGGGEPGSGEPCDGACGPNEKCCNDACVDTRFDPNNCLSCGHGCPGTTCASSSCTNVCQQGFIDCNKNVVDGCEVNAAVDPANCGNCDIGCGFQVACVEGYCVCPNGTADCDGSKANGCEVDITSDKAACGACGKACAAGQTCTQSACECAVGFLECNGNPSDGCESVITASDTCGSCSLDCGPHGLCVAAGECGCATGYLDCDEQVAGCETPINDPAHCGACGVTCPASLPACDGTKCTEGCGGLKLCGGSCVDIQSDAENCGACGRPVGANQTCAAGKPTCKAGFADCDASPGCETNTQTDSAHCGACTNACKLGAGCDSGSCACAPTTPNDCGATCAQCCNDSQCSDGNSCTADVCSAGSCSVGLQCAGGGQCCSGTGCFNCCNDSDCDSGKVCTGNQCVNLACTPPQIACNLKCVNPTNDAKNCGGCGNDCGMGRTCSASGCTPSWVSMAPPPTGFVARERAASAALGSKLFVWGGNDGAGKALADGATYDPATNTWAAVPTVGTPPSARVLATAVWTGSVMIVWGGGDIGATADYDTGSRFDPATNSWSAMTTTGAPVGRRGAYGFWTGSRALFYGGVDRNGIPVAAVNLYDPVNNAWSEAPPQSAAARTEAVVGWSGSLLLLYGGRPGGTGSTDTTYTLDLAASSWKKVKNGPSARYGAFGAWDGALLVAWGGWANGAKGDGESYDPVTDKWTPLQAMGAPAPRYLLNRQTGWAARVKPRVSLLLGGYGNMTYLTSGATYNSTTNAWTAVSAWPSGASHIGGAGVWTGTEFVLWGGKAGATFALTNAGERYLP